jgi:hypothetical protein
LGEARLESLRLVNHPNRGQPVGATGDRDLGRRVGRVVGYPPLSEMSDQQRREFHDALLEADTFKDCPFNGSANPGAGTLVNEAGAFGPEASLRAQRLTLAR